VNRVCPLATILSSKLACRSRGVSSSSSPKSPFSALRPLSLRLLPQWCPADRVSQTPNSSVSSACSARSRIAFVTCFRRPFSLMNVFRLLVIGQQLIDECLVDGHRFLFSSSDGRLHSPFYTSGFARAAGKRPVGDNSAFDGRDRRPLDLPTLFAITFGPESKLAQIGCAIRIRTATRIASRAAG